MFAINTAKHESTGFSPAFLNFDREFEVPKAVYRQTEAKPNEPGVPDKDSEPTVVQKHFEYLSTLTGI